MKPYQMTHYEYERWMAGEAVSTIHIYHRTYWLAYPLGSRKQDWLNEITHAAYAGEVLPARVLDYIFKHVEKSYVTRFLPHDCPTAIPVGYINPDVKRINREARRALTKARKDAKINV